MKNVQKQSAVLVLNPLWPVPWLWCPFLREVSCFLLLQWEGALARPDVDFPLQYVRQGQEVTAASLPFCRGREVAQKEERCWQGFGLHSVCVCVRHAFAR